MTLFYVKYFNKQNKCPACPKSKLEGYSLCKKHIKAAKLRWRVWSVKRFNKGLCHSCDRKCWQSMQRCKTHTLINRERCSNWSYEKYHWCKDNGICVECREASNNKETIWCTPCRDLRRAVNKKYRLKHKAGPIKTVLTYL